MMNKENALLLDNILKPYCECVNRIMGMLVECRLHEGIKKHLNGLEFQRYRYAKKRNTLRNRKIRSQWIGVGDSRYPIFLESLNIKGL